MEVVDIWKDINGWEKYYEVNECGDVRNKLTNHVLIGDINSAGYRRVCLYNKNNIPNKKRFFVHRLVAEHFIDNPNNFTEVNHIDLNKMNNNVLNLEWVNRNENERHSRIYGTKPYKPFYIKYNNGEIETYDTKKECAEQFNVSNMTVKFWLHGKNKGFIKYNINEISYL